MISSAPSPFIPYSFKKIWVLFMTFPLFSYSYAQEKNFSVNRFLPSWIVDFNHKGARPNDKDITDGYFLSVYENQNHAELQEEYTHIIREIVSDAGVQNGSQINVTYAPGFQKLIFHKIILWRNNIAMDQLKIKKFKVIQTEKDLNKFIYSGTYDAFLLLEDVRKGDRIEYAFTIKGTNPIFGRKYATQYYFEGSSSIGNFYMNLITDKNRLINIKSFNNASSPLISEKSGYKLYEWQSMRTKTYRNTDYEPSWYNPFKRAQLTEYRNWNEVVNWGLAVNNYPDLKSPLLDRKIKEFKDLSGGDQKKYIELATRFVQDEIRYMGIEMGIYSHRPNSPQNVLKQRYGDCKDKSLLLVHLLKAVGIDAYMVYADTYSTIRTNEYLPSPFIFNHVIVVVEYGKQKTWIDPTVSFQRGKFDDFYAPDYGYVLVIKPGINALERITNTPKGKLISNLTFKISDTLSDKKSTLIIKSKYLGNYADNIRSAIAESGIESLQKDYLEYYGKYYTDIESSSLMQVKDDEKKNILELTEQYAIDDIWTQNENSEKKYISIYADLISNELHELPAKKRSEPLSLKYPSNVEQSITVKMPYYADYHTENIKIHNENYLFELKNSQRENTVKFSYFFRSLKPYIEGSEIKKYVKNYKKINENLSYTLSVGGGIQRRDYHENPYTIFLGIFVMIISGFFIIKYYQKRTPFDIEKLIQAKPIGGWLIALAILLIIEPVSVFSSFFSLGFFNQKVWSEMDNTGAIHGFLFKSAFITDLVAITLLFVFAITSAIMFFGRRADFPKMYVLLAKTDISISIFTFLLFRIMNLKSSPVESWSDLWSLAASVAICVLSIWYLKKSKRARQTFVFTYPEVECTKAMIRHYNAKLTTRKSMEDFNVPAQIKDSHENI
jgi:transglutaminase-like putative cysteine protease